MNDNILIKAKSKEDAEEICLRQQMFITFDVSEKGYREIDFIEHAKEHYSICKHQFKKKEHGIEFCNDCGMIFKNE